MFWPQDLAADLERFLKERFGLGVRAHIVVQHGQVVEAGHRVGMFRATQAPCDLNGLFRQRESLLVLSLSKQFIDLLVDRVEIILLRPGCGGCEHPKAEG
jgi:hypothetical protein